MALDDLPALPLDATVSTPFTTHQFSTTTATPLTGLTNKLTPFKFSVDLENTGTLISDDTVVWHLGDGNTVVGASAEHVYKWPGEYVVRLTIIDRHGNPKVSTYTKKIRVYNYFNDRVWWKTPGTENCYIDQALMSRLSQRFTIYRTCSWQSYNIHEVTGYTVNLYVSGSDSAPLTMDGYTKDKYVHFQRTWRYVASDDNRQPLRSVDTTTDKVYLKINPSLSAHEYQTKWQFLDCDETDPDGVFVGTTGEAYVHYIDDSAKNVWGNKIPVFCYASLDTSRFGDTYSTTIAIENGYYKPTGLDYFEHHRSVLPVKVLFNKPTHLLYTPNGIKQFPLAYNKLQGTHIPITVSLADNEGNIINGYYPELSADHDGVDLFYINLGFESTSTPKKPVPKFNVWRNELIPIPTYGSFSGVISSCDHTNCTDTLRLTGSIHVKDPDHLNWPEVTNIYVADVLSNELFNYRIQYRFPDRYSYLHKMTLSYNHPGIRKTSRNIYTPGMSAVLGIAINGVGEAWIADGDVDRIMKINACGDTVYSVPVSHYIPGDDNTSPVGIAVDENSDFIFSSSDTVSAFKVNGVTQELQAIIIPDVANRVVNGNNTVSPGPIETRVDNKIWIGYTNPLSTFMCLYENTGEFISRHALPEASHPVDILCDPYNETWVLGAGIGKETGTLLHLDAAGKLIHTISDIPMPGMLAMDADDNIWFSYGANRLRKISRKTYRRVHDMELGQKYPPPYNFISAIEGLASDLEGNILVIQNLDKKLYLVNGSDPFAKINEIDIPTRSPNNRVQAYGDWSGGRWINKFGRGAAYNIPGKYREIVTSSSEFRILPSIGCENIAKFNEDYDFGGVLQTYHLQPTVDDSAFWKEQIINHAMGNYWSYPWEGGKVIYEKIANFVDNVSDIDVSNIRAVYSMAESVSYRLEDYNYKYPALLSRVMDIVSIKHKKLFGSRNEFDEDYEHYGHIDNENYAKNLGTELTTNTYIVTAGVPIIVNELYGPTKRKIVPLVIGGQPTDAGYDSEVGGLVTYPLSTYTAVWGWGLSYPITSPMEDYYTFYSYELARDDSHIEGVIDWSNWYTTLQESNSGYHDWSKQYGIAETIIDISIKQGLDLIYPCYEGQRPGCISDLQVTADRHVILSWADIKQNREIVDYYRVLRSDDSGETYTSVGTVRSFTKSNANRIVYEDILAPQCATYSYKVQAVNNWGSSTCQDAPVSIYLNEYHGLEVIFKAVTQPQHHHHLLYRHLHHRRLITHLYSGANLELNIYEKQKLVLYA